MSLVREDPPPPRNKWARISNDLRALEDRAEWHRVETFDYYDSARYAARALRRAGCDACHRQIRENQWGVWARWAE